MGDHSYELDPIAFDDLGPRRVIHLHDPQRRLRGLVVVDTQGGGPAGGGVRMAKDLCASEIARLARAMTYKYALLGMPVGGAKAGIWLDPADPERDQVLAAFREAIAPLAADGTFLPGPDLGTTANDFPSPLASIPIDERLTGYGVVAAARAAAEFEGRTLAGSRVAIEGFGKVGSAAAERFVREGAHVVAISTVHTTLYREEGLDVAALLALRAAGGDDAVETLSGAMRLPREALFTVPTDVLVPGARPDALHLGNVGAVVARLIVPGSNIPYAKGALAALAARRITAVPDFLANAGGVLAMVVAMQGLRGDDGVAAVESAIAANVRRVAERAKERGSDLYEAAVREARDALGVGEDAANAKEPPRATPAVQAGGAA